MCLEDDATVDSGTPTNDNDGVEFINMDVECSGMVMILRIGRHSGVVSSIGYVFTIILFLFHARDS